MLFAVAVGCTSPETPDSPSWDGTVQQWGTLRGVMHGEIMDGQVRLSDVTGKPHIYGIGAPDGLRGEILVSDSVAWVAEVHDGDQIETRQSDSSEYSAVFLAVAQVPQWTTVRLERDVSADEFDDFVQKTINDAGLNKLETVPFVIDGYFSALELHVLNGQCPFAKVETQRQGSSPPYRTTLDDAQGLLVGFYSDTGAGRITHHWTRTHVHALVGQDERRIGGHVDAVALKAGTFIRVPTYGSRVGNQ